MAVIHDMMPAFELLQPTTVDDAVGLLDRYGADALVMAGGLDNFDWLKDRIRKPRYVVDLSGVEGLRGVKAAGDGVEIGAMTTLTEVVRHELVRDRYRLLSEGAEAAASPQIRNQGTIGGNVSQDARCWYYRAGWSCYRAGGNVCYADTPTAINREHAIFGADRCVAVNPSDTAPALIALDAKMVIRSAGGERIVDAQDYFVGPGVDIMRLTTLRAGELLTTIRIPGTWAGKEFYTEKVADRKVWDFPLMNIAATMALAGANIERARIVVNAAAATPMRLEAVEAFVAGKPRNEDTANAAGDLAVRGAVPLAHNAYKIPLMRNLVKRAIRGGDNGWASTS
jgi:xanthine dehydrogenase YagS FAD-binding subunit